MKTEDFILSLFEKAKQAGLEEYEVYCSIGKSFFTDVNNGEPDKYTVNDFTGISFRAKKDGRIGYCSTTAKSPETADFLIKGVTENLSVLNGGTSSLYLRARRSMSRRRIIRRSLQT